MEADLSTLVTVLAIVGPAAGAVASYAVLRERVSRHDRSIENFGERLGKLERRPQPEGSEKE